MTELARTRPESFFADRFNLTESLLARVLGGNLLARADDADVYLEYRVNEELQLEDGAVKKASRHVSQGAGVRALSGTRTGYAHTDDISLQNLEEAARQARAIADRAGLGLDGRRRPAADATERDRDRRGARSTRDRHLWRRRARRVRLLPRGRALAPVRAGGGAPGRPQTPRRGRSGRHDDRRARAGLAGHPAPRGGRPRARGRLQPHGN